MIKVHTPLPTALTRGHKRQRWRNKSPSYHTYGSAALQSYKTTSTNWCFSFSSHLGPLSSLTCQNSSNESCRKRHNMMCIKEDLRNPTWTNMPVWVSSSKPVMEHYRTCTVQLIWEIVTGLTNFKWHLTLNFLFFFTYPTRCNTMPPCRAGPGSVNAPNSHTCICTQI